jgi:hypothetical protein
LTEDRAVAHYQCANGHLIVLRSAFGQRDRLLHKECVAERVGCHRSVASRVCDRRL